MYFVSVLCTLRAKKAPTPLLFYGDDRKKKYVLGIEDSTDPNAFYVINVDHILWK